jgi:hypothetical protein
LAVAASCLHELSKHCLQLVFKLIGGERHQTSNFSEIENI